MPKKPKKKLPRERKPFWHERLECWYAWLYVDGKRKMTRLSKDEGEANRLWHERRAQEQRTDRPVPTDVDTVQGTIAAFFAWLQKQPKTTEKTVKWYKTFLVGASKAMDGKPKENNSFGIFVGPRLKISELKLSHTENWLAEKLGGATENGRNGAVRALRRLIRWAIDRDLIHTSPLKGLETPQYEPRDVRISSAEWTALLGAVPAGDELGDFLRCLRATGMRPVELRIVEARHLQDDHLLFDVKESKGKKYRRSVPLNDAATEILTRLAAKRPTGKLFRNSRGRAWTENAAVSRMNKYREAAGLGEHITLYAIRHEFISAAIETEGCDLVSLAKIVGHRDLTMISRTYAHLSARGEHLQKMVRKVTGEPTE